MLQMLIADEIFSTIKMTAHMSNVPHSTCSFLDSHGAALRDQLCKNAAQLVFGFFSHQLKLMFRWTLYLTLCDA